MRRSSSCVRPSPTFRTPALASVRSSWSPASFSEGIDVLETFVAVNPTAPNRAPARSLIAQTATARSPKRRCTAAARPCCRSRRGSRCNSIRRTPTLTTCSARRWRRKGNSIRRWRSFGRRCGSTRGTNQRPTTSRARRLSCSNAVVRAFRPAAAKADLKVRATLLLWHGEDVEVAPARQIVRPAKLLASIHAVFALEHAVTEPAQIVEVARPFSRRQVLVDFRLDVRPVDLHQIDERSRDFAGRSLRCRS